MFGCVRKLGCLVLLLVGLLGAALWFTRDRWLHFFRGGEVAEAVKDGTWEPISDAAAARGRRAIEGMQATSGPVYASLRPGELASYVFVALRRELPPSATDVQAAVIGDRLFVRANVALSDFGGPSVLGPLASFMSERETMMFGGTFEILRPGLGQYRVQELRLRDLAIPRGMIPRLVQRIGRGARPEGVAADALPLEVPRYVADVRVGRGRVTLYKNVQ